MDNDNKNAISDTQVNLFDTFGIVSKSEEELKDDALAEIKRDWRSIGQLDSAYMAKTKNREGYFSDVYFMCRAVDTVYDNFSLKQFEGFADCLAEMAEHGKISAPVINAVSEFMVRRYYQDFGKKNGKYLLSLIPGDISIEFACKYIEESCPTLAYQFFRDYTILDPEIVTRNLDYQRLCLSGINAGVVDCKYGIMRTILDEDENAKSAVYKMAGTKITYARGLCELNYGRKIDLVTVIDWKHMLEIRPDDRREVYEFFEKILSRNDGAGYLSYALEIFPKDRNLCHIAVSTKGLMLSEVPEQTEELIYDAVRADVRALRYADLELISDSLVPMCISMLAIDPNNINAMKTSLPLDSFVEILSENPKAATEINTITKKLVDAIKDKPNIVQYIANRHINNLPQNVTVESYIKYGITDVNPSEKQEKDNTSPEVKQEKKKSFKGIGE